MTDRLNCLIVSLDKDYRDDDCEVIINAIRMIKGVNGVTSNVVDPDTYSVETRVKNKIREKLLELIRDL